MGRKGYPAEFRRRALDLVAAGKKVARGGAAARGERPVDLQLAAAGADRHGRAAGAELGGAGGAARGPARIRALETELAVHRRAAELLKESVRPKGASRRSP